MDPYLFVTPRVYKWNQIYLILKWLRIAARAVKSSLMGVPVAYIFNWGSAGLQVLIWGSLALKSLRTTAVGYHSSMRRSGYSIDHGFPNFSARDPKTLLPTDSGPQPNLYNSMHVYIPTDSRFLVTRWACHLAKLCPPLFITPQ